MNTHKFLPKLIRLKEASLYLGMDKNRFNKEVRPELIEIPIGSQGIAFDRLDLDAWADHYKVHNGRPTQKRSMWDAKECQDSLKEVRTGASTKWSIESKFAKAVEQVGRKKREDT
jgi:hypothetical protein